MQYGLTLNLLHYYRQIWWSLFFVSAIPFIILSIKVLTGHTGPNPLQELQHATGLWALIFLLITLTVTPARQLLNKYCIYIHLKYGRRLEDWNWLIRLRRMLGLYCFFYATLHMLVYVALDTGFNLQWIIQDIHEKPYIMLGMISYLMLIPLAITSLGVLFLLMGKNRWQRLHKTIYIINILVIFHFWWQTKVGVYSYVPYVLMTVILLGYRLFNWLDMIKRSSRDDGMEVDVRR